MQNQAKLLKRTRLNANLNQGDIAKLLGVTPQFICNIENGRAHLPSHLAKKIKGILPKSRLLKAYLRDCEEQWLDKYRG